MDALSHTTQRGNWAVNFAGLWVRDHLFKRVKTHSHSLEGLVHKPEEQEISLDSEGNN